LIKNNDEKRLSSSSPWTTKLNKRHSNIDPKTSTPTKGSNVDVNPIEKQKKRISIDENDECDSSPVTRPIRKSIITTRSQSAARGINKDLIHRRKSSPPKNVYLLDYHLIDQIHELIEKSLNKI